MTKHLVIILIKQTTGVSLLLLSALLVFNVKADDWRSEINALRPVDLAAQETAVLDNLERRAQRALAAVPRAHTSEEADRARMPLRERLAHSLGLEHMPWPPDLQLRQVGTLQRAGYRIEKVVYQTLPGALVPALLYVPEPLKEPAPAVLFYPGHWWADSKARPDFQAFCINMARLGFVVLTFDPFGQGERGISSRDHRRTEALLVGIAQQGIAEYETRCALEYLLSRTEVDPKRVGMTGASGGGYNTWITTALDDRIAAAVPVVGTSDFFEQIHVCRPLDWYHAAEHCHFVPGLIHYANNHELLAMAAPKPLLIIAAAEDQSFPIAGVRAVHAYGQTLYDSYRARDRIGFYEDQASGHGLQQKKREAAYGWFLRWLMKVGDGRPHLEPPTETEPFDAPALRCFPAGENQPAGPAIVELVDRLGRKLPPQPASFRLESVLGPLPAAVPIIAHLESKRVQRVLITSEPDLNLPAFLLRPAGDVRGIVVAVDDRGKEALASEPVVQEALDNGWAICGVDPRGIGELATSKLGWVFAVSLLLGENFVGRQAWDIARTIDFLSAAGAFPGKPIGLYARGHDASLAAVYVLAHQAQTNRSRVKWYVLRDGFLSYRAFFQRPESLRTSYELKAEDRDRTTAFDREIPAQFCAFDVLRSFDLPQLLASSRAAGLIVQPIDGDWHVLSEPAARRLLPPSIRVVSEQEPDQVIRDFLREHLTVSKD